MVKIDVKQSEKTIYIVKDSQGNVATGRTYEEALEYIKKRKKFTSLEY